ncbi:hypothetical protein PsYK624_014750 [Phanerochaete sordida]|uniref:Uncharacterized protein n=1 Tax=Phanerochaete sordida TaxID=48140 RepID=A0A9P3FZF0_9APHY|nr:hypothetical protein PsYK624_014750 [Phanerochaete sordida]
MELTTEYAWRIFADTGLLKEYLPRIVELLNAPELDGTWVETYTDHLGKNFAQSAKRSRTRSGWDPVMKASVEAGVFETMFSLVKHYHGGQNLGTTAISAIDCVVHLASKANDDQRLDLLSRAVKCDALNTCIHVLKVHELCMHRYAAGSMLRVLCTELGYVAELTPAKTAAIIEYLCRHALDETESYSIQFADPDKAWQAYRITTNAASTPEEASDYGLRFFGLTQENCVWSVHGLLFPWPVPPRSHVFDIVRSRPAMLDLLLDIAMLPRPHWYPESIMQQIAGEIIAQMLQLPLGTVPGLEIPLDLEMKAALENEWQHVVLVANLLMKRPEWLPKLLKSWKRLDRERVADTRYLLHQVRPEWHGLEPPPEKLTAIYDRRGQMRVDLLSIIVTLTFADIRDVDLISLLRLTYEATKRASPISRDAEPTTLLDEEAIYGTLEWRIRVHRIPISIAPSEIPGTTCDATQQSPPPAVCAPLALLRILTLLAERGVLAQAQTWRALPAGIAPGVHLVHVHQILSDATIEATLNVLARRVAAQRESGKMDVSTAPWAARAHYRQAAQLAGALLAFDAAERGRWAHMLVGVRRELVLCLGNAAEMSNRVHDYGPAAVFANAALDVAEEAPQNEGIAPENVEKNARRLEVAKANLT